MNHPNAIEIRQLAKRFSQFQLGPLDMTVPADAVYGFIGPNGSGKTTTLDLMFGLGFRDSGNIQILGLDHERDEVAVKQQTAYMSPELDYDSWGNVKRAVLFIRGFYDNWDQAYCDDLLARFNIEPTAKIASLSFGNKVKLSLVLALARRPKVIVLDEPTVGIDALSKRELFAQLLSLMSDGGRTVLISSHSLADLERFADHIGVIDEGQMILEGRIDKILESWRHVDFNLADEPPPNARIVDRDGNRFRVLTNSTSQYEQLLLSRGADHISVHPVTLEELLVGLVKGK